ncbi:MAG: YIP1 family protein, partial [Lachnospiraceae bacterium]|nr:YIP1 family protein [Lachnospiraceae bacterium]
ETLKYVFHVIFHPFDGFWDLKHEKKGSVPAALTFVVLTIITLAIEKQDTAFLFNKNKLSELNVLVDIITVALVFILWCVANWCTTSLMDGKGKMVEIVTAIGYAVFPIPLIRLPLVFLSHLVTMDEGAFIKVFGILSLIWAGMLVFFATSVIHEYSIKKTVVTVLITILGMGILMFIGLLFFNVIEQMINFVLTIYKEIRFR